MTRKRKRWLLGIVLGLVVIGLGTGYYFRYVRKKEEPVADKREAPPIQWFAAYAEACQKHGELPDEASVRNGMLWNLRHCSTELSEADQKRIAQLGESATQEQLLDIDVIRGLVKNLTREGVIWPYAFVNDGQRDRLIPYLRNSKPTSDIVIDARKKLHEIGKLFTEMQAEMQDKTPPETALLLRWAKTSTSIEARNRVFATGPLIPAFDAVEAAVLEEIARFWNDPITQGLFDPQEYPQMRDGGAIPIPPTRLQKYQTQFAKKLADEEKANPSFANAYTKLRAYIEATTATKLR